MRAVNVPQFKFPHRPLRADFTWSIDMTIAGLRERLATPLEWIAGIIAAHPKATLIAWAVSLAVVAWVL